MTIQNGDKLVLPGFERNYPVTVVSIEPYDYVRDGKHFKFTKVWVRMPDGDLLDVDPSDLRKPN